MTTEQQFRELLTDKLIEVAEHPKMRKEFSVIYKTESVNDNLADDNKPSSTTQILFYKNGPMMSNVERYAVVLYLLGKSDEESFAKAESLIEEVEDEWDNADLKQLLYNYKAKYFRRKGDEEAYFDALAGFFNNSAIYTHMGDVYVENLEEYYDFLVKNEVWEMVYYFVANLFSVTEQQGAPLSDPNYLVQIHNDFTREELDFLRKVHKDVYIDNIIPKEYYDPEKRRAIFETEEQEDNLCGHLAYSISIAYRYTRAARRPSPKKGSFDYLYNKAEKGDKKAMAAIADAYRTGIGTRANPRLADYWQKRTEH